MTVRSQRLRPVLRSKHRTLKARWRALRAVGSAVTTKTRFSQTMGDPDPRPGIRTFHFTFFVLLHSVGGLAFGAVPFPVGPRQWAQFPAVSESWIRSKHRTRRNGNFRSVREFILQSLFKIILRSNVIETAGRLPCAGEKYPGGEV